MAIGTFVSLGLPNYRKFFAGQAVSLIGTWIQSVAMGWLILQISGCSLIASRSVGCS